MNNSHKNKKGLTLIETLVAISVLLMAVVSPMVIYSQSITNTRYAGERITAYYLAQEAIELVKYRINTEFNKNEPWFYTLPDCNSGNCTISIPDGPVCFAGICDSTLYLKTDGSFYNNISNTPVSDPASKFKRTVKFADNPSENGALVSSTVTWKNAGVDKSVTIEEYMTKWR